MADIHSKRARVAAPPQQPSSALVTQAQGILMQSSRKERSQLLAGLLKQCAPSDLEQLVQHGLKLGCWKPLSANAPFQAGSTWVLDAVFSFLDEGDLRGLAPVCRRWRVAC